MLLLKLVFSTAILTSYGLAGGEAFGQLVHVKFVFFVKIFSYFSYLNFYKYLFVKLFQFFLIFCKISFSFRYNHIISAFVWPLVCIIIFGFSFVQPIITTLTLAKGTVFVIMVRSSLKLKLEDNVRMFLVLFRMF